jgi:hypothetical protein
MDEDQWGAWAARVTQYSYGPIVKYFRHRHIDTDKDKEPEWRRRGAALTSGYTPRW